MSRNPNMSFRSISDNYRQAPQQTGTAGRLGQRRAEGIALFDIQGRQFYDELLTAVAAG
jgi:hypothetical protein